MKKGTSYCNSLPKKVRFGFTLAEGTSYCNLPPKKVKFGFTLAEVLITLGIIGVVAALTIPTLIANAKGIANKNKFKKAVATFSQAARMSQAKYGFDYSGVEPCKSINDNPEEVNTICALWNGTLAGSKGYMNTDSLVEMYEKYGSSENFYISDLEGNNMGAWQLADGSLLITWNTLDIWGNTESAYNEGEINIKNCTTTFGGIKDLLVPEAGGCQAYLDINGPEGPNKIITCTQGQTVGFGSDNSFTGTTFAEFPCTVSNKDISDIFPVIIHDGLMEPASNAARYVMNSAK